LFMRNRTIILLIALGLLSWFTVANATGFVPIAAQQFNDGTFRVFDNADPTKGIAFQVSGVTTGTTRTITFPDSNVSFGDYLRHDGSVDLTADWIISANSITLTAGTLKATNLNLTANSNQIVLDSDGTYPTTIKIAKPDYATTGDGSPSASGDYF